VLGNRTVTVTGDQVRLADGTLAGSVLTMDRAVRNLLDLGVPAPEAIGAATTVPAGLVGHPGLGSLTPGTAADIAVLDDSYHVTRTLVAGHETFAR
jgi:N-acetylglucosamine-6-phosphate deacetylase